MFVGFKLGINRCNDYQDTLMLLLQKSDSDFILKAKLDSLLTAISVPLYLKRLVAGSTGSVKQIALVMFTSDLQSSPTGLVLKL